jgi:hypothetical protein
MNPQSQFLAVKPGTLQRKCECGGGCDSCKEKEKQVIQRQAAPGAAGRATLAPAATSQIQSAMSSGGQALPATTRASLEPRFGGRDFSGVRVHADGQADGLARQIGAQAFTVGNSIFFASGQYAPQTPTGQRLLAHELAHTVQQGGQAATVQPRMEVGEVHSAAEQEADRVAELVTSGLSAGPISAAPSGGALVQRYATPTLREAIGTTGGERIVLPPEEPLRVYGSKCKDAADFTRITQAYDNAARRGALRATHSGRVGNTDHLWDRWARSRGAAGQTVLGSTSPDYRHTCSPDHIIELQVGGGDDPNNLRILSRSRNQTAGSSLNSQQITPMFQHYFGNTPTNLERSYIQFSRAVEKSDDPPSADPCLAADPNPYPWSGIAQSADYASTLNVNAGGNPIVIGYGRRTETAAPFTVNPDHQYAVGGLELKRVTATTPAPVIRANISDRVRRLPLKNRTIADFDLTVGAGNNLVLSAAEAASDNLRLTFPFLSEAAMTPTIGAGQLNARGVLRPTLPLLRFAEINMEIRDQSLFANAQIPNERIRQALPVPGLTIENCNLGIAVTQGEFSATGGFGFRFGSMASGAITASLSNTRGFNAQGNISMRIPGIDEATGEAWVRNRVFGARLTVGKDNLRFPGVQSARLVVDVNGEGQLSGTGNVVLRIPGLRDANLTFTANSQGQYGITGAATGTIPGLRDPRLQIAYANGALSGTGSAGFVIPGFEGGNVTLRYAQGAFSGDASIDYRRGRLSGRLFARLSPQSRLSGGGELSYQIVPGLTAMIGMQIREDGTTRVQGELRLPDPIVLFPEYAYDRRLFGVSIDIPIFGISFGSRSVGIIANISASMNARAGIGPGQIRRPRIMAAFEPSEEANPASFQASGELYVPASAGLSLVVSGGIGASLLIVKALGGIQATGTAGLEGALLVPITLAYQGGKFNVTGAAELYAQPKLRFQLDAFARVEADLLLTTIELYSKTWRLAAFEWGSDFRIGLRFPVSYTFGEPFRLSLDQVQFIAPQVDVRRVMRDLLPK